jgi:amino acid transporter
MKNPSIPPEGAEPTDVTNTSMKDPDTMLSMIVLLLTCLGLAVLAHVVVLATTPWSLSLMTYILFNDAFQQTVM